MRNAAAILTAVSLLFLHACSDGGQWQDRETLKDIQDGTSGKGSRAPANPVPAKPQGPAPEDLFKSAVLKNCRVGEVKTYDGEKLADYIDGEAELYYQYGFVRLATAKIDRDGGKPVRVNVFFMSTPLNAFGIFSQYADPENYVWLVGTRANCRPGAADLIRDRFFVQVRPEQEEVPGNELADVGFKMLESAGGEAAAPGEFKSFPAEGRIVRAERYVPRDYLGVKELTEVFECAYRKDDKEFKVFVSFKATPGEAEAALGNLSAMIVKDMKKEAQIVMGRDKHDRALCFMTSGRCVLGAVDPVSFEQAAGILKKTAENLE